jgi:hypothetical protein
VAPRPSTTFFFTFLMTFAFAFTFHDTVLFSLHGDLLLLVDGLDVPHKV